MRALIAARPWLRVYRLPCYAPELDPVENIWSSLRRSMANLAGGRIDDLLRIAKNPLKREMTLKSVQTLAGPAASDGATVWSSAAAGPWGPVPGLRRT